MKYEFVGGIADGKTIELPFLHHTYRWPVDRRDHSSMNMRRMVLLDHEEYVFVPTTGKYHLPQSAAYNLYLEECNRFTVRAVAEMEADTSA